jgi:acyl carrier protein
MTMTNKNDASVEARVKQIIVDKLGIDEKEITLKANFTCDLGADSLDTVELIIDFEREFNIVIPDVVAEELITVGDAVAYIEADLK